VSLANTGEVLSIVNRSASPSHEGAAAEVDRPACLSGAGFRRVILLATPTSANQTSGSLTDDARVQFIFGWTTRRRGIIWPICWRTVCGNVGATAEV